MCLNHNWSISKWRRAVLAFSLGSMLLLFCSAELSFGFDDKASDQDKSHSKPEDPDVYTPGGEVRPPKLVHYVEPQFNNNSSEAFVEGVVKISTVVTTEGEASDCRVTSGLTASQNQTALEALKQWRFQPGTKAGKPVKVRVTVEVGFHLL